MTNLPHPRGKNETKRPIVLHYHHKSSRKISKWNPTRSTQKKKTATGSSGSSGSSLFVNRASASGKPVLSQPNENQLARGFNSHSHFLHQIIPIINPWMMYGWYTDIGQLIGTYFGWNKRIDMKKNESETSTEQTLFTDWWFSKSRYKYTITRNVPSQPLQNRIRCINSLWEGKTPLVHTTDLWPHRFGWTQSPYKPPPIQPPFLSYPNKQAPLLSA